MATKTYQDLIEFFECIGLKPGEFLGHKRKESIGQIGVDRLRRRLFGISRFIRSEKLVQLEDVTMAVFELSGLPISQSEEIARSLAGQHFTYSSDFLYKKKITFDPVHDMQGHDGYKVVAYSAENFP